MKVLFLSWKSLGNIDMVSAFKEVGCEVKEIPFTNDEVRTDPKTENYLANEIKLYNPDFVFSFNYFPIVSLACKSCDMVYVSWTYDSPYVLLYSYTILYPKNYIFVFDKELYMEYQRAGINTVYYLPLAANPKRLSSMKSDKQFLESNYAPQNTVSFIGSLYTEKHNFYQRLEGINSYTRGYLEGLIAAQKQVYGYNFIQDSLPKEIIDEMFRVLPMHPAPDGIETLAYLYAQYVINRQITGVERIEFLTAISKNYGLDLYTHNRDLTLEGCCNHGPVDYYDVAPYVFRHSKINLNITLRSIKSGIPLRCFDIIGAGGFLLTNFQPDFADCFVADEDYVFYDSLDDMMNKIAYYAKHDEERLEIAKNGFRKLSENHSYTQRALEILSIIH